MLFPETRTLRKIAFTIVGEPIAQGRPRAFKTPAGIVRVYQPTNSRRWQDQVRIFAVDAMGFKGEPINGPVKVEIVFYMKRPGRLIWKSRPMPACPAPTKPDIDNLYKAVADGLEGVCFLNDNQVVDEHSRKFYTAGPGYGDQRPRVEVAVEEIQV